jgi:hypothetical protein
MAITVRLGTPADNAKMQDLITKITMPGVAQMCFQRAPDFFVGAKVIGDEFVLTVADDDERPDVLAGLTVISGRELYISGKRRRVYYSGDTRVDPYYRRRGIASNLFIEQKKHRSTEDLLQGIVLKENTAPLDAAKNSADGVLFDYWISHSIETSFIFTRKITPRIPSGCARPRRPMRRPCRPSSIAKRHAAMATRSTTSRSCWRATRTTLD